MAEDNKPQRVGILTVHGIGEQCQFEHLEQVVRDIASALQADSTIASVQVNINVSKDAPYRASQQIWRGEGTATAVIEVVDMNQKQTHLEFREVWWSDLDEPNSLKTFLNFWGWGLSLWSKPAYDQKNGKVHPGMRLPGRTTDNEKALLPGAGEPIQWVHRLYLFLVSFVVVLLLPLLWVLGRVSRSLLGLEIKPDLLVEYLGDIKLYQQDAREGKGPLVDLGKAPPRFSIRRRLINALVEMSLDDYDRWYVLSHSLGTVVAFNGLMEIDVALPRYLDRKLWKRWCRWCEEQGWATTRPLTTEEARAQENALPSRPSWLSKANNEFIDRQKLFCKLRGFMTYGSPLSKFAVLWPLIVPLNQDESAFGQEFEWINVLDPTDPVADFTRFFDAKAGKTAPLTPKEIAYKAEKIHLLSHGEYLTFNPKKRLTLVRQVSRWIVSGDPFPEPSAQQRSLLDQLRWPTPKVGGKNSGIVTFYFGLGIVIWFVLGILISFILSWLIPSLLAQVPSLLAQMGWNSSLIEGVLLQIKEILSSFYSYLIITVGLVGIVGAVIRLLNLNKNQGVPPKSPDLEP